MNRKLHKKFIESLNDYDYDEFLKDLEDEKVFLVTDASDKWAFAARFDCHTMTIVASASISPKGSKRAFGIMKDIAKIQSCEKLVWWVQNDVVRKRHAQSYGMEFVGVEKGFCVFELEIL